MALLARPVDPRDIGWEVDRPAFRVYLWRQARLEDRPPEHRPAGLRQSDMGWVCLEWELTGGDVDDVLSWADAHAVGRDVAEVWVVVADRGDGHGKGMVRLRGYTPTAGPAPA